MHQATLLFELTLQLHVFLASWRESRLQMRLQDDCGIFGSLMPALIGVAKIQPFSPGKVQDKVQLPKRKLNTKDQSSFKTIVYHNSKKSVLVHLGVLFLKQETCIPLIQIALEFFASIFFCLQLHLRYLKISNMYEEARNTHHFHRHASWHSHWHTSC